jgi:hypothetical protein
MKFLIVALAVISALGAAGDVGTAALGTAIFTNGTTLATAYCESTATLDFSTNVTTSTTYFSWDFLWLASATAIANGDYGIGAVHTTTSTGTSTAAPTCFVSTYTSATARSGGSSLTCGTPTTGTVAQVVFKITVTGATTLPGSWNSTLNAGKTMKFAQSTVSTTAAYTAGSALTGSTALIAFTGTFTACENGFKSFWKSDSTSTSFLSGLLALSFF